MTTTSTIALRQVRDQAAEEPLRALRGIRGKLEETGRPDLARVLAFVEEHVFEEGTEAGAAAAVVGANLGTISPRIEAHTGYSLEDLIARVRFETAASMKAAHPEVSLEKLSEVLGLSVWRLTRLFERWPAEANQKVRRKRAFDPGNAAACDLSASGMLSVSETKKVLTHLRSVCPEAFSVGAPAAGVALSGSHTGIGPVAGPATEPARSAAGSDLPTPVENATAERLWSELSCLSYSAEREVVQLYAFASRAFFDLLLGKSRAVGRRDRQRGVEIAELALLSGETSATMLGERVHEMRVEGLAWLGNAHRLALDFFGADAALKKALRVIDAHKKLQGSLPDGVAHFMLGNLRLFQQSYAEASSRFDYALTVFERHGSLDWQIRCHQQRAAAADYVSGPAMAIPYFEEILPLLVKANDDDLTFQVRYNLANCLNRSGHYKEAAKELRHLREIAGLQSHPLWASHVIWAEGNIDQGLRRFSDARKKYVAAAAGFEAAGAVLYTALAKLDMAILASETSEAAEVVEIVTSILPVFESLSLCTETVASLGLLAEALPRMGITTELLRRLREALCKDPLIGLAADEGGEPEPSG